MVRISVRFNKFCETKKKLQPYQEGVEEAGIAGNAWVIVSFKDFSPTAISVPIYISCSSSLDEVYPSMT